MGIKEIGWGRGLNLTCLRQVAGCCEHGNGPSGSEKCWEFVASWLVCQSLRQCKLNTRKVRESHEHANSICNNI
jgi:hypothetical protein